MRNSRFKVTWATQQIESITFRGIETTSMATAFYVILSLITAAVILRFERIVKKRHDQY